MKPLKEKGDCDCCTNSINVVLYELHSMKMCASCYQDDADATAKAVEANAMIQQSRTIDSTIEIKLDVFKAETVAAQDVMNAILSDDSIPAKDKNYAMAAESLRRFQHLQSVIFEERKAFHEKMQAKENQMRAWQVQIHTFAAKVEDSRKEQFRNYDISYTPTKPKTVKSPSVPSVKGPEKKKFNRVQLFDAANKYGLPFAAVQMTAEANNLSAEDAAKFIVDTRAKVAATN